MTQSEPKEIRPADYTLLVVDDDDTLRAALLWDLKRKGYQTLEAENGEIAFQLTRTHKVDMVLTDIRMPVCDGIELLKRLKQSNVELPIVMFISGFSDLTPEEASDQGAEAVFTKPFERKVLLAAIQNAVIQKEIRWARPNPMPNAIQPRFERKFESLVEAQKEGSFRLGRGGFFLQEDSPDPAIRRDSPVAFSIEFASGDIRSLPGYGKALWTRSETTEESLPPGVGIEILNLDPNAIPALSKHLEREKPLAWVPRR
jgi:CheY-like chemotaxis protein